MHHPDRVHVLGVPVDAVGIEEALAYASTRIATPGTPDCIIAINPEKVFATRSNTAIRELVESAGMLLPDGIGIVMALRLLHGIRIRRIAGADYMQALCARAAERGWRIYLYGASETVNDAAATELLRRHPSLLIAGRSHGFVPDNKMDGLVTQINESKADILFVALGSPRQEEWLRRFIPRLTVRLCQGIGGTLDTLAGTVKRAPVMIQQLNLEWLYRLLRQPSRAGRQKVLIYFVMEVIREWRHPRPLPVHVASPPMEGHKP